ncbi:retinol-binding protein pinta-like [Temnothorax nylanderi]|uniref:retinol-binding protein pinta-like n=1 Tax=Temnothorax nylanderi TaxID=102681 RepID=UPI003A86BE57
MMIVKMIPKSTFLCTVCIYLFAFIYCLAIARRSLQCSALKTCTRSVSSRWTRCSPAFTIVAMASSCSDSVMNHAWKKLSNDDKLYAATQLNETDKNRENSIAEIRHWIEENDDLRGQFDDFLILRFLRVCKFNLEKTKIRIQNHYKQRSDLPEWYMNTDPFLPELQELLDLGLYLPLRNPDDQGRLVILVRVIYDPRRHEISNLVKVAMMAIETAMKYYPAASIYGYTMCIDLANMTVHHIAQCRPYILKNTVGAWQNYPMRMQLIDMFNAPLFYDITSRILKSFMTEKLKNRFNVYSDSTVHNCLKDIPANILPVEYGGTDGTIQELTEYWKKLIEENRDSLMKENDKIVSKHYMQNRLKEEANIEYDGTDGTIKELTERWKKLIEDDHDYFVNEENDEIITKL